MGREIISRGTTQIYHYFRSSLNQVHICLFNIFHTSALDNGCYFPKKDAGKTYSITFQLYSSRATKIIPLDIGISANPTLCNPLKLFYSPSLHVYIMLLSLSIYYFLSIVKNLLTILIIKQACIIFNVSFVTFFMSNETSLMSQIQEIVGENSTRTVLVFVNYTKKKLLTNICQQLNNFFLFE